MEKNATIKEQAPVLLHHDGADGDTVEKAAAVIGDAYGTAPTVLRLEHLQKISAGSTVFVMIDDAAWIASFKLLAKLEATLAIVPYGENPRQCQTFNIPAKIEEAILPVAQGEFAKTDTAVLCEGEPLLGCLQVGDALWIEQDGWSRALRRLFSMRLIPMKLTTAKGQEIRTAAMLVEAAHETPMSRRRSYFFSDHDDFCRRVCAVVYAPQSILEALKLRLFLAHRKREKATDLPAGIGTLKSEALLIESDGPKPLSLHYNGRVKETRSVTLTAYEMKSRIALPATSCTGGELKESVRTKNLPADEEMIAYFAKKSLPLLPMAPESAFAELFTRLRESAAMTRTYLTLLVLSVLMATVGLFQNSAPTIIGAMILAPMMAPIIALAMGAVRFDAKMTLESLRTLTLSIFITLAAASLLAQSLPFTHVTQQIALRTHPTLLDLAVAILSGIAAAYGYANSKVGESLAGVAIAVALVPPLSVAGIGIGWGQWHLFSGAFLLFGANIAGIVFAAGVMFYLLGYASRRYVSAAFFIKLLMVAAVAFPLWLSTRTLVLQERIDAAFRKVAAQVPFESGLAMTLERIEKKGETLYAYVTLTAPQALEEKKLAAISRFLKKKLGKNIRFVFTVRRLY